MACNIFWSHKDPPDGTVYKIYLCDTLTDRPSTGLTTGELCICRDTQKTYVASDTTSWVEKGGASGATAFTGLSDVPASYTGQAGKYLRVKATEDGLENATPAGSGDMTKAVYDPNDDGVIAKAQLDASLANTSGTNTGDQTIPAAGSTPSTQALGDSAAGGSDSTWSKNDHKHGMPTLASILLAAYPVGAVYCSVVSTSPATLFGGTWAAFGAGKVLVGLDSGDTDFDVVEETGGAKTVNLAHTHDAHGFTQPTAHGITQPAVSDHAAHTHTGASTTSPPKLVTANTSTGVTMVSGNPSATLTHSLSTQVALTNNHAGGAVTPTTHASNLSATQSVVQPYVVVYMFKRTS